MSSIARRITSFTQLEIRALFKGSCIVYRQAELEVRAKPTLNLLSRLLIVIPRKIGNAPERNKLRRRLKALFYQEKLFLCSFDYLIFCKKNSILLSFDQLKTILLSIAQSIASDEKYKKNCSSF